jgi:tetratricopeptide (TPR) repeat protein
VYSYLKKDEANLEVQPVQKRRICLLKAMGRIPEAILKLSGLLSVSPIDAEAWSELSELYVSQGMLDQAIFCLEEVLLIQPNAWNVS